MTTLPQTTGRMPRPSNAIQPAAQTPAAPFGFMAHSAGAAHQMTPSDVWRVLRANAWLISAILVASIIVGYGVNRVLLRYFPKFTATAIVAVSPPPQLDPLKVGTEAANTQILFMEQQNKAQLLKQPALFREVLTDKNSAIRDTSWFQRYNGDDETAERDLGDYFIVSPIQDTNQIRVEFAASDQGDAVKVIGAVVNQLISDDTKRHQEEQSSRSMQLTNLKAKKDSRRTELLSDMHDKEGTLNISGNEGSGKLNVKLKAMEDLTSRKMEMDVQNEIAKAQFDRIKTQIANGEDPPSVVALVNADPDVLRYKQMEENIELDISRVIASFGPNYPQLKQLQDQKDIYLKKEQSAEDRIRNAARAQAVENARENTSMTDEEQKRIQDNIVTLDTEIETLNRVLGDYLSAKDELADLNLQLKEINDQLDQIANFTAQKDQTNLEWDSLPSASAIPTFPKLSSTMTISVMLGLALSLGIAFLRETLDTTVRSPRDITRVGNLPLLGIIPHQDDDPQSAGARLPMVIFESPQSMIAEQLRQVRTRLQHAASLDTTRTILITSPSPNDGKSTIAANLASGLALNGRRILLVDANFRRPAVHKMFGLGNDVGFSDVLNKIDLFSSAVQPTQVPNLSVLTSGSKPTNATELMESQLLADFIERAVEDYDHVIFDSGPLLLSSETAAMAPRVDGVVTVVRAQANSRGLLQRLRDNLRQVKAEHLGVVLNAVRSQGGGYYRSNIRTYYDYQNGHSES